jgi:acyl-coenzyme A thioesterase 13
MPFITLVSSSLPTAATSETEKVAQPRAIFRYTVQKAHCNALHNLHGGATATLFDFLTTLALVLVNAPGFWWYVGVTRTLNVTYLRPAAEGETVLFESEVVHAGQRLCSLRGVMRRESDGLVLATCEHGKVNTDPPMERGSKL